MKLLLLFIICYSYSTVWSQRVEVDLRLIANKSLVEVEDVLGKSTREEKFTARGGTCECTALYFLKNHVSIVFIDNEADWITAYSPVEITNIDKVKVMALHRDPGKKVSMKLKTMKKDDCCTVRLP